MKTNLIKKIACLAVVGAALAWAGGATRAYATDLVLWSFDSSAPGWISLNWALNGSVSEDTGAGNPAGALDIYDDMTQNDQFAIMGYYSGAQGNPNTGPGTNLLLFTNLVFDILWDTNLSTVSIPTFNSAPGIEGGIAIWSSSANNSYATLGYFQVPAGAATNWQHVNFPLTPTTPGISTPSYALGFKKWTSTYLTGAANFWIDNITLQYSAAPPPSPTLSLTSGSVTKGLNIYDDGAAYDRQSISTIVANTSGPDYGYAWIGNPTPVSYSVHVAKAPGISYNNYQLHFMIVPGRNITETAPDWNEASALVWFIDSQPDGSVVGTLRYKLNNAGNNTYLFGSDTSIFGGSGSAFTNTIVAGYGGLLGTVTNVGGFVGTWSLTFNSDTDVTLQSPDGSTHTVSFPQESDAQAFAAPVTVFWGTQPNTAGYNQDVVLSNVSITGSSNTLNADLTQPLDPAFLAVRASNPSLMFTTPANAVYWLQWTLPDAGFGLQSASSLSGSWSSVVGPPVTTTNYQNSFGTQTSMTNNTRDYNPGPMGAAYDYGNATSSNAVWASGPTYDAGNSSSSGSLELSWTWDYTANGDGSADFTLDVFPSAVDCSGGTLSFDIMIDPSSTPGLAGDYGYLQVALRDGSYNFAFISGFGEGLITAAGGATNQWAHVSIPLGSPAMVRGLTFQDYNDVGRAIDGPETIYIDNLQLTGVSASGSTTYTILGKRSVYITSDVLPSSGGGYFRLQKP